MKNMKSIQERILKRISSSEATLGYYDGFTYGNEIFEFDRYEHAALTDQIDDLKQFIEQWQWLQTDQFYDIDSSEGNLYYLEEGDYDTKTEKFGYLKLMSLTYKKNWVKGFYHFWMHEVIDQLKEVDSKWESIIEQSELLKKARKEAGIQTFNDALEAQDERFKEMGFRTGVEGIGDFIQHMMDQKESENN